jgi:monoamine oxidase
MDWDLIIVGGGISGLAAADALVERGWRVLLLERASRLGGRIRTDRTEREPLEMGPSFVGPTQGNMQALIRRFGLGIKYNDFPDDRLSVNHFDIGFMYRTTFHGTYTSVPEIDRAIAALDKLTAQAAANLERPWDLAELAHFDSVSVQQWSDQVLTERQYGGFAFVMRHLLAIFVRSILSVEPAELSMLFFLYYCARCGGFRYMVTAVDYGPDSQRVREGLDTLVARLAQSIRERGGTIRTDAEVSTIDNASGDRVGVVVNGEQIFAHRMVVAVPPSAAGAMQYRVPLPEARRRLCAEMQHGSTFKGYVVFDEPWFHHLSAFERFRKTELRMPRLDTTLRTKQTGALSRMRSMGVIVPTGYTGYTNGDFYKVSWTMDGTWYDSSGKATQPAIMWFVVGENARQFAELDPEARRAKVFSDLEELFRGCRFPTDGVRYYEQDWTKPPHDAGPTEVMREALLTNVGAALREPFGRIHWAGTEAAVHWGGYMEGGVDAGLRAAREAHDAIIAAGLDPPRA